MLVFRTRGVKTENRTSEKCLLLRYGHTTAGVYLRANANHCQLRGQTSGKRDLDASFTHGTLIRVGSARMPNAIEELCKLTTRAADEGSLHSRVNALSQTHARSGVRNSRQ